MRKSAFWFSLALVAACFAALLYAPSAAIAGVKAGLSVCTGTIIPALLPFLVLSGLVTALELPKLLSRIFAPLMRRLFRVPGVAAAPLLLGLTGGYPVGAAATAELVQRGDLSPEEGSRVLAFCNNTGPAFIVGAAGSGVFGSAKIGLLLYLSHILAAVAVGMIFSVGCKAPGVKSAPTPIRAVRFAEALTGAVKGAVTAVLNICGFVVLFSTLRALLDALGVFSGLAGWLAAHLHIGLQFVRAALTGVLELGGGITALQGLPPTPGDLALASFILGFGSLSVHCQTLAAVAGAELKTARHFAGRLLHGAISALLTFLIFTLLRI